MPDKPPADTVERAREIVTRWRLSPFGGDDNVLIDRIAAQVAAEKEKVWDAAIKIAKAREGKRSIVVDLEAARTADIKTER